MRIVKVLLLVLFVAVLGWLLSIGPADRAALVHLFSGTPHERYAARLRFSPIGSSGGATAWLDDADRSLRNARPVIVPSTSLLQLAAATALSVSMRRGERLVVDVDAVNVFIDLFRRTDDQLVSVVAADEHESGLDVEIRDDGEYVLRVQRKLASAPDDKGSKEVRLSLAPSLRLPVANATPGSIQSFFGADRDGGRRAHHGVDIFAARGTPVIAASGGIVSSVGTNGLGGKVVWVVRPGHLESHYYAHLDRQLVSVGTLVDAGDVIGTVGNTGNARTTAPHLHFGIYGSRGAIDPLPYVAPRRRTSADS